MDWPTKKMPSQQHSVVCVDRPKLKPLFTDNFFAPLQLSDKIWYRFYDPSHVCENDTIMTDHICVSKTSYEWYFLFQNEHTDTKSWTELLR